MDLSASDAAPHTERQKKNGSVSIKLIITAIAVLFSLAASMTTICFAYFHFRDTARQNLIQSTEFNLSLVSGLISQDLQELNRLRTKCENDDAISAYLANAGATSAQASRAYENLASIAQSTTAYRHLLRLILVSEDRERILQTGSGTTNGKPVTAKSISLLDSLELDDKNDFWQGIYADPFTSIDPVAILAEGGNVYRAEKMHRSVVGHSCLMLSLNLFREPLRSYQLPEGGRLFLTVEDKTFSLDDPLQPEDAPALSNVEDDSAFDSRTLVRKFTARDGTNGLMVSCPIGSSNLYLSQSIPAKALTVVQFEQMKGQLALLVLLTLALGAFLLLTLHRLISQPLKKLQERMRVISEGNFTRDPSVEWNNEIGQIGKGINDFACNMQDMMERRVTDEKARQELEYDVLLNQVNPHFLYNTLNSIKWMATIQQAPGIAEMTSSLARLLKTVSKGTHSLIPLSEELSLLDDYYVIQKYRCGGSITVTKEIDPETENALIPRFSLQPLLENAIFHGIEPKGGVGTIRVTSGIRDRTLVITMEDDGIGIPEEQISTLLTDDAQKPSGLFHGIGLSNVNSRIRGKFGREYGLQIESEPGSYTRIFLTLPYITGSEQEV